MKNLLRIFIVLSLMPVLGASQSATMVKVHSPDEFRVDPSKPYVYLEVKRIGPRQPRNLSESSVGIWLLLHNNSKVSIVVQTFGVPPEHENGEIGVMDFVVANPPSNTGDGSSSYEMPNVTMMTPKPPPQAKASAEMSGEKPQNEAMPHGYMYAVGSTVAIPPGKAVYFSLPREQIGHNWHVEIPFRFALRDSSGYRSPTSSIALYKEDLPVSH